MKAANMKSRSNKDRVSNMLYVFMLFCCCLILTGCTNWKKKYQNLDVAHQNLKGRYEHAKAEKGQLAQQISQGQQTIDELQRKIAEQNESPGRATGFGDEYDVKFDPSAGTVTVTLDNRILFTSGRAELRKATIAELDHIYSVLQNRYSSRQIDVVGHTDSDPIKKTKWKDNLELSAQRALTVTRYLIKRGFPKEMIRAAGSGASRPIGSNSTASGKARNRRVEIVVYVR